MSEEPMSIKMAARALWTRGVPGHLGLDAQKVYTVLRNELVADAAKEAGITVAEFEASIDGLIEKGLLVPGKDLDGLGEIVP